MPALPAKLFKKALISYPLVEDSFAVNSVSGEKLKSIQAIARCLLSGRIWLFHVGTSHGLTSLFVLYKFNFGKGNL